MKNLRMMNSIRASFLGLALAGQAVAAPGDKLWEFPVGASIQSSPALTREGLIVFGADNGIVYALSPDGRKKWEFRTSGSVVATPAIGADGVIYIAATDRILYALNPDGSEKWRLMPGAGLVSSPALGPDGTIYVGSAFGQFFAIESQGLKRWDFPTGGNIVSSPAIAADGLVLFGCGDTNLYAVSPEGARKWLFRAENRITASPAIGEEGDILFGSLDGFIYCLAPNGEKLWDFRTGDAVRGSPVIGPEGAVYCGSDDKKLYALSFNGRKRWEFATGGWIRSTPALGDDGGIYFGSYDGKLYALDAGGQKRWEFAAAGAISGSPLLTAGGVLYFGSWDKTFYAVQAAGPAARSAWPMFRRHERRTGSMAPEGKALAMVPTAPQIPVPPPPPVEEPKIILPPVAEPTFTNRVSTPPVRFADLTATPRELIISNETIFLKPPPKPPTPPIERLRKDKTPPRVEIKSPSEKERLTHSLLVVEGTARDNEGLERIEYRFNGGEPLAAEGLGDWTVRLQMRQGPNSFQVRAVDLAGNASEWASRTFNFLVTRPLLVQIAGEGDVSPNLAGQYLEVGKSYTLTAEPARGWAFSHWSGSLGSDNAKIEFVMRSNLVLRANFVRKTPLPTLATPKEKGREPKASAVVEVRVHGQGTVKPDFSRRQFVVGEELSLAARPAKGHEFAGWKGDLEEESPEIHLVIRSNMVLRAEFVPHGLATWQGIHQSLIWDTNGVSHETSGLIELRFGGEGDYRGRLWLAGESFNLAGKLDSSGRDQKLIVRGENRSLRLDLKAESSQGGIINGSIRDQNGLVSFATHRLKFDGKAFSVPAAGKYTMIMTATGSPQGPIGDGFATLAVAADGAVNIGGELGDGTSFSVNGVVAADGRCPIYLPLYGGRGSLSGYLRFGSAPGGLDVSGQLAWFKPESPKDKLYPMGLSRLLALSGSRYQPPADGQRIVGSGNAVVALSDGNLPSLMGHFIELDQRNRAKIVAAGDEKFAFNLAPATGLFQGAFTHPATGRRTEFRGAVLQKLGWGSGHFLGVDRSGLVFIGPHKEPPSATDEGRAPASPAPGG